MTTVTSGRAATLIGALALLGAACAPLEGRRADTTGQSGGGIGGTGVMAEAAGLGVFGTITGLGSIDLNGLHIQIPAGIARDDLLGGAIAPLAVGQSVAVVTAEIEDALVARSVVEILPLVGPVEGVDTLHRRITVMGTSVRLDPSTPLLDRGRDVALPPAGSRRATGWRSAACGAKAWSSPPASSGCRRRPSPGPPGCCASSTARPGSAAPKSPRPIAPRPASRP